MVPRQCQGRRQQNFSAAETIMTPPARQRKVSRCDHLMTNAGFRGRAALGDRGRGFNFVASGSIELRADGRNHHEAANVRVMKSAP
jgi:hypothetical protein